uniref:Uncharacterized protein MANES_12G049400 n=1 Tax=Rhizophora mucronata TaxID=61149 RepID=A0A2P2JKN5_RHIMU
MSRCFPFPPPGYEKKDIIDDTDLLAKEKRKDKKHKKDKKDKEKREGKEKKDKDISKEKHREKKERKEKHKDKDRDKEKNQIIDKKRVEGQPQLQNGEKVGPNSLQDKEIKDSRYVLELSKRIREDDEASGSQFSQKTTATVQRRAELPGRAVDSSTGKQLEEREKVKDKNEDHRKVNGQRNHIDTRGVGKTLDQNYSGMGQEKVDGIARLVEKDTERQTEGKEKSKHNKSDNKDNKHKQKHRDQKKHRKSKDKEWDKEKKKEEKARDITDPTKEHLKLKESSKDSLDFRIIKTPETLKLSSTSYADEGNLGKRKEPEMNGYIPGESFPVLYNVQ